MRIIVLIGIWSLIALGLSTLALLDESQELQVTRHHLGIQNRSGLKIAQISDLHVVGWDEIEDRVIAEINREDPDVVVMTGDILPAANKVRKLEAFLDQLSDRAEKIAILGNWEYVSGMNMESLRKIYQKHQVTLLINEAMVVGKKVNKPLLVIGLDEITLGQMSWTKAVANHLLDWRGAVLVLAHNPKSLDYLPAIPTLPMQKRLVLSGHTHGGQIVLFGLAFKPTGMENKTCTKGWCPNAQWNMYISRGIGTSIIPLRIGARPELSFFEWAW